MSSTAPSIATSTVSLATRLASNERFGSIDFQSWLLAHLAIEAGMDVLDVGCGNGAQTLRLLDLVGAGGSVSALDLAAESVAQIRQAAADRPLQAEIGDMADLEQIIAQRFQRRRFDLAQSTYALYYAADPVIVLDAMRRALKPGGRMAVCVPNNPHGLVDLVKRFRPVPKSVEECGAFGPDVLEPYFRRHCTMVDVHMLRNDISLPSADEVIRFLANSAYYDPAIEVDVRHRVEGEIARTGQFRYQKNSYLIVGSPAA